MRAAEHGAPSTGTGFVPPHLRGGQPQSSKAGAGGRNPDIRVPKSHHGLFPDVDTAVAAAHKAFDQYQAVPLATREKIIAAMRKVTLDNLRPLSEYAVEETGLGRVEDKLKKNELCANKTPGPEILRPIAFTGDHGFGRAGSGGFGVIGAITPTTNATETIINNGISMLAGGNAVVFNTHPYAWRTCGWYVHIPERSHRRGGWSAQPAVLDQ